MRWRELREAGWSPDDLGNALRGLRYDPKGKTLGLAATLADHWVQVGKGLWAEHRPKARASPTPLPELPPRTPEADAAHFDAVKYLRSKGMLARYAPPQPNPTPEEREAKRRELQRRIDAEQAEKAGAA